MRKNNAQLSVVSDQPMAVSAVETGQVSMIPLDDLRVAEWNARKTIQPGPLAELAESIRKHGLQVPLIVRPFPESGWHMPGEDADIKAGKLFEVVAGHRRMEAMARLGLTLAGCIVRLLDDTAAREISLVDNLQREDVPALEEAKAFEELRDLLGSLDAVAVRVGKEAGYVAKRLRLCALSDNARVALSERLVTVDHALLLARLGVDQQDEQLKWLLDPRAGVKMTCEKVLAERIERCESYEDTRREVYVYRTWEPATPQRLKEHIEQHSGRLLSRAPWDLDDALLIPDVGACLTCPQNTKANTSLFGDLAIEEATCADGGCFEAKRQAFVNIQLRAAAEEASAQAKIPGKSSADFEILRVSWMATSTVPRQLKDGGGTNPAQLFKGGQWIEAKKGSCADVRRAVTIDWSDAGDRGYMGNGRKLRKPGEILLVCVASKCSAHPKSYEQAKRNGGGHDEAAEKAKEAKRKDAAVEEGKLRVAVASKAIESVAAILPEVLRHAALQLADRYDEALKMFGAIMPGFKKALEDADINSPEFAKALALVSIGDIAPLEWGGPDFGRAKFLKSIRRLGYKGELPWDKPQVEAKASAKKTLKTLAKKAAKKAAKKGVRK